MGRSSGRRSHRAGWAALAIVVAGALACAPSSASAAASCDRVASPTGSDSAPGTEAAPFATAQKLADSLSAGQAGCLRGGNYAQSVKLTHGGAPGSPVTITSYPGERARVVGRLWVDRAASFVTLSSLDLDGVNPDNLPSPTVYANDVTFTDDDVTNENTTICFILGVESSTQVVAQRTVITRNRIHHCGKLPPANHDHGIYMENTLDAQVTYNLIYANADRGIQLYPNAQRTTIAHNVIDSNGEGILFSGADGFASSDTTVSGNIITNATVRSDVESWYPSGNPVGTNNQVTGNCIFGGRATVDTTEGGFTPTANTFADPQYRDAAHYDYRLQSTSPCLSVAGDTAALLGQPLTTVTATPGSVTVVSGSTRAGGASALAADDGVTYQVNADLLSRTASWYGTFAGVANSLRNLTIHYHGSSSSGCNQTVSIYRFADGTWVTLDSRSIGTSGVNLAGLTPSGNLADYVSGASGDGDLRVRVICTAPLPLPYYASGDLLSIRYDRP